MADPRVAELRSPATGPHAEERDALSRFVALLEREREALVEPDPDTLNSLVADKLALLQMLDRLRDSRIPREDAAGRRALAEIRMLATAAQRLNDLNTRLLAVQRSQCEARLQTLRNNNALASVYGADGRRLGLA